MTLQRPWPGLVADTSAVPLLPAPCPPLQILLAEDQARDAHLIRLGFRACDVPVKMHHVYNGRAALDFLLDPANPRPDVLLLDLYMPEMDGLECLAALQAEPALAGLPVVVLSDACSAAEMAAALAGGARHFIRKPVDMLMFFVAIGGLLPSLLDWRRSEELCRARQWEIPPHYDERTCHT